MCATTPPATNLHNNHCPLVETLILS